MNNENKCVVPPENKKKAFHNASIVECPIISRTIASKFIPYAIQRGFNIGFCESMNNYDPNDKKCVVWKTRNEECRRIINEMRLYNKSAVETEGPWKGMPTIEELNLILRLSSTMNLNDLKKIAEKLEHNKIVMKKYQLRP